MAQVGRTQGSRHKICDKRCSIATNVVPGPVLSFPYTYIADAASLLPARTLDQGVPTIPQIVVKLPQIMLDKCIVFL